MVQREGRILRKGNKNESVKIFRYICEGSFDAYSWQILETKQRFISQFLTGSAYQRTASDLEENVLTYAQVKALAISEPRMKELAEKQNGLRKLQLLSSNFAGNIKRMENELSKIGKAFNMLEKRYCASVENLKYLATVTEKDYADTYAINKERLTAGIIFKNQKIFEEIYFLGFKVTIPETQNIKKPFVFIERLGAQYLISVGEKSNGNARRIINFLKKFDKVPNQILEQKNNLLRKEKRYKKEIKMENPYKKDIKKLKSEITRLESEIKIHNKNQELK